MTPQALMWAEIEAMVAPYGVTRADLVGPRVTRPIAWSRQMACSYLHRTHGVSKSHIGRMMGGRDHATILHGIQKHEARMAWAELLRWSAADRQKYPHFAAVARFTVCCKTAAGRMRLAA